MTTAQHPDHRDILSSILNELGASWAVITFDGEQFLVWDTSGRVSIEAFCVLEVRKGELRSDAARNLAVKHLRDYHQRHHVQPC
jgi:hypothetical protein